MQSSFRNDFSVCDLGLLSNGTSHTAICGVHKEQYRLAEDLEDSKWIKTTHWAKGCNHFVS